MLFTFAVGAILAGLLVIFKVLPRLKLVKNSLVAMACTAILLGAAVQPALAGAVSGDALSNDQKDLNETLLTTSHGNQYQGIEYTDAKGVPLTDREITSRVEKSTPENLKVSVSNGSVRLSGKVADRSEAQAVITEVKSILGVHEVAYDLGLSNAPEQQ